ncbi:GmrSD restriction endonuclease domain-containing protein [Moheibacter sp.]|uniref:GmrSD restriction endonuclease domain-containing protein n=1 Tax=Moheibacter sp. TaxID=1965316 RepID=UPI003C77BBB7
MKQLRNENPLVTIKDFKGKTFVINKYQRGYRWGKREIYALLKDILAFDIARDGFYCLQPLVMLNKGENNFELIDGQQRATTIYLILKYLLKENYYQIHYETRGSTEDGSNEFLTRLHTLDFSAVLNCEGKDVENHIWTIWKTSFCEENAIEDTVDHFYFFKAYCLVQLWFIEYGNEDAIKHNLLENTKVIWYTENVDSKNVAATFINFNNGKIQLDQAELVKGLFVLDINKINDSTRKSYELNQFADEWNAIEQHLNNPEFWNFIQKNRTNKELANKITILLEIEKGKGDKEEDLYYTFRAYEKAFAGDEKPEWRSLATLYNLLDEWYHDRETYHLMGAVVHLTSKTIHTVLQNYRTSSKKNELKDYLKKILREEFFEAKTQKFKNKYDINEVKYGKSGVFPILFLYNIAVAQINDKKYLFPFDLFNSTRAWNIEHIYAKNSLGFETKQDLQEWMNEIEELFTDNAQLTHIEELKTKFEQIKVEDLESANVKVKEIEALLGDLMDKDHLSNLCLLDDKTNIQVGKKVFRKKRNMILELDSHLDPAAYVPIATKQIFQKALTPSDELTLNYWNTRDRDAYMSDILHKITTFLK